MRPSPAVAVEGRQRALQEGCGDGRTHVRSGVEKLFGNARAALGHFVEGRAQPIKTTVDCNCFFSRQCPHRAAIAMRSRNRFGDPEASRPTFVRGMVYVAPFPLDQSIDQPVYFHSMFQITFLTHRVACC